MGRSGSCLPLPLVFRQLNARQAPQIHGEDCPTPDGTCVRDFIHVSDIALAHRAAARALAERWSRSLPLWSRATARLLRGAATRARRDREHRRGAPWKRRNQIVPSSLVWGHPERAGSSGSRPWMRASGRGRHHREHVDESPRSSTEPACPGRRSRARLLIGTARGGDVLSGGGIRSRSTTTCRSSRPLRQLSRVLPSGEGVRSRLTPSPFVAARLSQVTGAECGPARRWPAQPTSSAPLATSGTVVARCRAPGGSLGGGPTGRLTGASMPRGRDSTPEGLGRWSTAPGRGLGPDGTSPHPATRSASPLPPH